MSDADLTALKEWADVQAHFNNVQAKRVLELIAEVKNLGLRNKVLEMERRQLNNELLGTAP